MPADPARVVRELEGIRGELRSIAQSLVTVEKQNRVTALMTRIQLKQQRLSSIESQLRSARGEQEGAERDIERLTEIEQSWTAGVGEDPAERLSEEQRQQLGLLRQQKKNFESQVATLRMRIVDLENDFARAQKDILALEETVDEQLGLR